MFYRFDVDRWIIHQLPPVLRRRGVFAFLRALLYPLKQLMQTFTAYREAAMRQLSFNAFTIYLEKWLNDLFFFVYNDIYITDGRLLPAFLYELNEFDVPVYMTFVDEDPAVPMELYSWPTDDRIGFFIVNVPPVLSSEDIAVVEQWVNYYKFAGTQFTISQYE